nr:hypothetical protein [Tanacetum cinerariifolium]
MAPKKMKVNEVVTQLQSEHSYDFADDIIREGGIGRVYSHYYGEFYYSEDYKRWEEWKEDMGWSEWKFGKSKKNGKRIRCSWPTYAEIFTDSRHNELLSRLCANATNECIDRLAEAAGKSYLHKKISLRKFICTLRDITGMNMLVEAVAIGQEGHDLLRGWRRGQTSKKMVFLVPGVIEVSLQEIFKGIHYFDSVCDVLNKVALEPELIEVEANHVLDEPQDDHEILIDMTVPQITPASESGDAAAGANVVQHQPVIVPQRHSSRNRMLTTKAFEAFSSGYLGSKRKRKGKQEMEPAR